MGTAAQYVINRTLYLPGLSGKCLGQIEDGYYKLVVSMENSITEVEILNKKIISVIRISNNDDTTNFGIKVDDSCVYKDDSNTFDLNVEYFNDFTIISDNNKTIEKSYLPNIKYFPEVQLEAKNAKIENLDIQTVKTKTATFSEIKLSNWTIKAGSGGGIVTFSYTGASS